MLALIYTAAIGLSIGVTATVARRIGEGRPDDAARTAAQAIALGLAVAVPIAAIGVSFGPQLLRVMGASPTVVATGSSYVRVMLGANAAILLLFLINAVFRGAGDATVSMRALWIANAANLILDPCLIFGLGPFPRLGVTGAAVATSTGRSIGVLYQLWRLSRPGQRVQLRREHLALDLGILKGVLRISASGVVQVFVGTASWIGLIRILAGFGSTAVAGYTIGIRVVLFALLPSWGLSNAAATIVGQALGAGKPERAERAVWQAAFYNMLFLGTVGLIFVMLAGPIVAVFTRDPAVSQVAVDCLRVVSLGFLFYAYGMVLTQSFNGAGDTRTPTLLNLACFWLWEIPLAWILAHQMGWGPRGVFTAITIAFSTLAVASAVLFRRGRWKVQTV
jgi:putative MATE family efflux protein